jgi:hypothetical protein
VAVAIVDRLEIVEVHQQQRGAVICRVRSRHGFLQSPVEALAIQQAGQVIGQRLGFECA